MPDILESMHYPREFNYLRDSYPCKHFVCPIYCVAGLAKIARNSMLPIKKLENAIGKCHEKQPLDQMTAANLEDECATLCEWTRKIMSKFRMFRQYPYTIKEHALREASAEEVVAVNKVLNALTAVEPREFEPPLGSRPRKW